jgi:hypothetical protein
MPIPAHSMFLIPVILATGAIAQPTPIPSPHPLITEILAAVPSGPRGDANGDGTRDAVGDEFIELVNPHDKPIQLKGYMLVDSDAWAPGAAKPGSPAKPTKSSGKPGDPPAAPADAPADKPATPAHDPAADSTRAELRFVFPEMELKPGQVVVVFNGYHQKFIGPVGDATKAPSGPNDKFHDAFVFSMKNESPYAALGNEADFVLLVAPDGKPIHVVKWGKTSKNPPKDTLLSEDAPASIGSVQRDGARGKLVPHRDLKGDLAGTYCSPGIFSMSPGVDPPANTTPRTNPTRPNSRPNRTRP